MPEFFKISTTLPATPKQIYTAWMGSKRHTEFTGEPADVETMVGGHFKAFGNYITGVNLELKPYRKIVQSWRTTEFPDTAEDSRLEIDLEETRGGTKLTMRHSNIPDGQAAAYKDGWKKFYFARLKTYFLKRMK